MLSFPVNRDHAQALLTGPPGPAVTYPVTRHRWDGFLDAPSWQVVERTSTRPGR